MKAEVGKQLDINKLSNVPTSLNNSRTEVDDLDVAILKILLVDLKTLSDVVDNKLLKKKNKRKQFRKENSCGNYFDSQKSIFTEININNKNGNFDEKGYQIEVV